MEPSNNNQGSNFIAFDQLLSACLSLVTKGGQIILDVFHGQDLQIKQKGYDDPFTIADLTVQKLYMTSLKKHFSSLNIIGEEGEKECSIVEVDPTELDLGLVTHSLLQEFNNGYPPVQEESQLKENLIDLSSLILWIDPLDGTKDFTLGNIECSTSLISGSINGKAEFGIIHHPLQKETYFGSTFHGVFKRDEAGTITPVKAKEVESEADQTQIESIVTSKSHLTQDAEKIIQSINPKILSKAGGAGNKFLYLLDGRAECYVYPMFGMKSWDVCGGDALVKAMGGAISDSNGNSFKYHNVQNIPGVIASLSPKKHSYCLKRILDYFKKL